MDVKFILKKRLKNRTPAELHKQIMTDEADKLNELLELPPEYQFKHDDLIYVELPEKVGSLRKPPMGEEASEQHTDSPHSVHGKKGVK